jgi:hypothetical protein
MNVKFCIEYHMIQQTIFYSSVLAKDYVFHTKSKRLIITLVSKHILYFMPEEFNFLAEKKDICKS